MFVADVIETLLIDLVGPDTVCVAEPVLLAVPVRVVVAEPLIVKIAVLFTIVPTLPVGLMLTPLPPLEIAVPLTTAHIFGGIAAKTGMAISKTPRHKSSRIKRSKQHTLKISGVAGRILAQARRYRCCQFSAMGTMASVVL